MVRNEGRNSLRGQGLPQRNRKLAVPPRLRDSLFASLSVESHAKYLYFHNRFRGILDTILRKGASLSAVRKFGQSADWLRVVDHLFRNWSPYWGCEYLQDTYPAFEWPDNSERGTVDPLTFAFLVSLGLPVVHPCVVKFLSGLYFSCPFCGRRVDKRGIVLRFGVPCCGCETSIRRPVPVGIIQSDSFSDTLLCSRFRTLCDSQRILDFRGTTNPDIVFGFVDTRLGETEQLLARWFTQGVPVFVFEQKGEEQSFQPLIGGISHQ